MLFSADNSLELSFCDVLENELMKYTSNSILFDATYNTAFSLFTQWLKFKLHNSIVCLQMFPKLSNIHTNTLFKRQTSTSYIIKNEYELAFLSTKSGFTLYYLSKETACKHVIIYITGFQTLPIMHNLHYLKKYIYLTSLQLWTYQECVFLATSQPA